MKFLVIDDDVHFLTKIKNKITEEYVNVSCDTFTSLPQSSCLKDDYSVIILDILIGKYDGVNLAKKLKEYYPNSQYVFISYNRDMIFRTQYIRPLCFIRKSNFDEDFTMMQVLLKETKQNCKTIKLKTSKDYRNDKIEVKDVNTDDILFVECNEHKLQVHTVDQELTTYMNLRDFMILVEECPNLIQIHKSYAINMNYIYKINENTINILDVSSKYTVPLARRYKKMFKKQYEEFILL